MDLTREFKLCLHGGASLPSTRVSRKYPCVRVVFLTSLSRLRPSPLDESRRGRWAGVWRCESNGAVGCVNGPHMRWVLTFTQAFQLSVQSAEWPDGPLVWVGCEPTPVQSGHRGSRPAGQAAITTYLALRDGTAAGFSDTGDLAASLWVWRRHSEREVCLKVVLLMN